MKVRIAHVSNSSTSSFFAWGFSGSQYSDRTFELDPEVAERFSEFGKLDLKDVKEIVNSMWRETSLKTFKCSGEILYIGLPFDKMKDDETLKEFKQRTLTEIHKIIPGIDSGELIWIEAINENS